MNSDYYHYISGSVYKIPLDIFPMGVDNRLKEYKKWVKSAYGNLLGVKFVIAKDRAEAFYKVSEKEFL